MEIKEKLIGIVGAKYFSDAPQVLKPYSKDYSVCLPGMPNYLVRPKNVEEIQRVVKVANECRMPVVPCSSGIHFNGNTILTQGGIMLDLSRMDKILDVDEGNRKARLEPGVTWSQLQVELEKHDLMALIPLLVHPLKSALASHLEREPMLIPKFEYADPLLTMEVILPNGDLFRTGSACVPGAPTQSVADGVQPEGPGLDWWRLFQGAQGTMGVVTWANVKVEYKPKVNKTFFIPFQRIEDAIEPIYRLQRRMIGQECLLLNNFNLAAILAEKWPEDFEALRKTLPPWTVILVLAGGLRRPEEKIEYEEEALREICSQLSISDILLALPGASGVEKWLPEALRKPWPKGKTYWKFCYKGSCQDLFFHTTLNRTPEFTKAIAEAVAKHRYPPDDVGLYLQPLEQARACHYECNFYYNPDDAEDVDRIRHLFADTAETLLDMGAFFTRPYGPIAEMVYQRAAGYTMALRKVKGLLDPNNILSPGRLCF